MNIITQIMELVSSSKPFTDIHLEEGEVPMLRGLYGWEEVQSMEPTSREDMEPLLIAIDQNWQEEVKKRLLSKPFDLSTWRLRLKAFQTGGGEKIAVAIRRQPATPLTMEQAGLPVSVKLMTSMSRGIILVSGPTGAGKTTTLASMVDEINSTRQSHIITIERPIEYIHRRKQGIVTLREVGVDVNTFLEGVEDAVQQSPDIILIGEIRDAPTARAALLAAESGHLVMASIHANTAVSTVQKILGFFGEDEYRSRAEALATTLVGVICQIRLPRKDKTGFAIAPELLFNQQQQFSKYIDRPERLQMQYDKNEEQHSTSMKKVIAHLIQQEIVDRTLGTQAVNSMGQVIRHSDLS